VKAPHEQGDFMARLPLNGLLLVLPLLAGGWSCSPGDSIAGDRAAAGDLRTDQDGYVAIPASLDLIYRTYAVTVVASFTNAGTSPVYLQRCYPDEPQPTYGVASLDAGPEPAYDPVWACVGHNHPIVVGPGATRVDSLVLMGPNRWNGYTHEPFGRLEGRFHVDYGAGYCREIQGCELPASELTSNVFTISLTP
jgi:hypothetical protein